MPSRSTKITCVQNDGQGYSYFAYKDIVLTGSQERVLSEQIPALNFRLRESPATYKSDFHVAGDSTLLIILAGTLRVELRNGEYHDFRQGDKFIAEDYLDHKTKFDDTKHGHRAKVIGEQTLSALHLKLEKRA